MRIAATTASGGLTRRRRMPSIVLGVQVDGGRLQRRVPQVFLDETQMRSRIGLVGGRRMS